jgi:hypothetical protein
MRMIAMTLSGHGRSREKLPLAGTSIVAANFIVTIWHVYVLGRLQPEMTGAQLVLFGGAINLVPICAMALLWTSRQRTAGLIFAVFFGVVFTIELYEHFLRPGADNVFTMAPGAWTLPHRLSASLLVVVDALGCLFGIYAAVRDRSGRAAI